MESQLLSVPEFHRFGANALADWAKSHHRRSGITANQLAAHPALKTWFIRYSVFLWAIIAGRFGAVNRSQEYFYAK